MSHEKSSQESPEESHTLLSPTIDIIFKLLLVHPESRPLLIDLGNTFLNPKDPFVSMLVLNPEIPANDADHKGIILDVVATTATGEMIQIEMQARHHTCFKERAFYYATRLHSSQLTRGDDYQLIKPTYCINFLRFNQFAPLDCPNPEQFVHIFEMRERSTQMLLTNHLEVHFIELLKFKEFQKKNPRHTNNPHLDNWLQFLLNPSDRRMEEIVMSDPIINQAMDRLRDISSDTQARERARMREVAEHEWASMIGSAQREGEAKGRAEGEAKGRAEGEAKGRAEGEAKAKLDVLNSLLTSDVTAALAEDVLAKMVGLPVEQVAEVRAALKG